MNSIDLTRLKRPRYPMPNFVQDALLQRGLMKTYHRRPAYQQNDYIRWITRAKRKGTQEKPLVQMLDELESGDRYMNMPYHPKHGLKDVTNLKGNATNT